MCGIKDKVNTIFNETAYIKQLVVASVGTHCNCKHEGVNVEDDYKNIGRLVSFISPRCNTGNNIGNNNTLIHMSPMDAFREIDGIQQDPLLLKNEVFPNVSETLIIGLNATMKQDERMIIGIENSPNIIGINKD